MLDSLASKHIVPRLPLAYVFFSGIGFSLQTLVIKRLAEHGFKGAFQCVFSRGLVQMCLSAMFMYCNTGGHAKDTRLFGDTDRVKYFLFLRAVFGYGGIGFAFMAAQILPIGDSTAICTLSPLFASVFSYFMLGEPWRLSEMIASVMSVTGAMLVARPSIIFGVDDSEMIDEHHRMIGILLALGSAISAGGSFTLVRILGTTSKMPWPNVCFAQAIGQLLLAPISMIVASEVFNPQLITWEVGIEVIIGGVVGTVSQILMTIGMQKEKSASATMMRMSTVVFGFLWQVLLTADPPRLQSIAGAVLVSSSVFVIVFANMPHDEAEGKGGSLL